MGSWSVLCYQARTPLLKGADVVESREVWPCPNLANGTGVSVQGHALFSDSEVNVLRVRVHFNLVLLTRKTTFQFCDRSPAGRAGLGPRPPLAVWAVLVVTLPVGNYTFALLMNDHATLRCVSALYYRRP